MFSQGNGEKNPATTLAAVQNMITWQSYPSPLYIITAPCVSELHRMRSKGCSGTTEHSKNFGMVFLFDEDETSALLLLPDFPGRESRPRYFVRPDSQAARLCRRDLCSSSSAVDSGRKNSRDAPRGA